MFSNKEKNIQPLSKSVPKNQVLFLICIAILSMIHPITLGYDSLMVGSILNLESYLNYFHLNDVTIGLNTASNWMGQFVASLTVTQFVADKFGRKKGIMLGISIYFIGIILQSALQNNGMFIVGRILIGFAGGITNVSAIVLVAELCPIHKRGFIMGIAFSSFLIGALLSSGVTYGLRNAPGNWNWRIPSIIQAVPSILASINLFFLPESPRFLVLKGYDLKALQTLMIVNDNDEEKCKIALEEFKIENSQVQSNNYHPWGQFFKVRINVHKAFINFTHAILTEMGGSSIGTTYLALLLQQAGIASSTERLQVNIVMSVWQLTCACSGCFFFDKIGRKRQATVSLLGMVISFYILGGLIKKYGDGANPSASYGTISVMFIFSGFYSFTYTPLTTLYPSELYPYKMRSTGASLFQICNCGFGLFAVFVLPIAMGSIGWKFYIINASYDILFFPIIYYVWIETKGQDLEQIDVIFWDHKFNRNYYPKIADTESISVERESIEIINKL